MGVEMSLSDIFQIFFVKFLWGVFISTIGSLVFSHLRAIFRKNIENIKVSLRNNHTAKSIAGDGFIPTRITLVRNDLWKVGIHRYDRTFRKLESLYEEMNKIHEHKKVLIAEVRDTVPFNVNSNNPHGDLLSNQEYCDFLERKFLPEHKQWEKLHADIKEKSRCLYKRIVGNFPEEQ